MYVRVYICLSVLHSSQKCKVVIKLFLVNVTWAPGGQQRQLLNADADTRSDVSMTSSVATNIELDAAIASAAASKGQAKALVVHFRAQWCREPGDAMAQLLNALACHFPFQVTITLEWIFEYHGKKEGEFLDERGSAR